MQRKFNIQVGLALILLLNLSGNLSGEGVNRDIRGDRTVNQFSRYSDIHLKLNKNLFENGEEIPVEFGIKNTGFSTFRIYPSSIIENSFQFLLTDNKGREIPFQKKRMVSASVRDSGEKVVNIWGEEIKEIILHPGESFEKTIYISDYYKLIPGNEYRLIGYFYPDYRNKYFVKSRNIAHFRIAKDVEKEYYTYGPENNYVEPLVELTPEETVYLFLSAEMRGNNSGFLKYLDLRKYIHSYDRFSSNYIMASTREKPQILKKFELYLSQKPEDRLINFKIIKKEFDRISDGTVNEHTRSYVIVRAERESKGYRIVYNYKYTLEKNLEKDGFWKIVLVTASVVQ